MLNYFEDTNELLLQAVRELVTEQTKDLSQSSGEIEQLKLTKADNTEIEELDEKKADKEGEYPKLCAGNLTSHIGFTEKVPYLFRTAGGAADIADREEDTIVGGSVAWNQLVKNGNFINTDEWSTYKGSLSVANNMATVVVTEDSAYTMIDQLIKPRWIEGHKMLYSVYVKQDEAGKLIVALNDGTSVIANNAYQKTEVVGDWINLFMIFAASNPQTPMFQVTTGTTKSEGNTFYVKDAQWFDLTLMFGPAIANYIYALESGTAGAGVDLFRKMFPKDYYPYDEGTLLSVKTSSHITTGLNQLDPETHQAKLVGGMEYQIVGTYTELSFTDVNSIISVPVPDAEGKFTPSAQGVLTVAGDDDTTCVHLVWDGEYDGIVEPYEANTYALDPNLELRGIPKLDADNNIYYDGDVYEASGKVTRRYSIVDLGKLNWTYNSTYGVFYVNLGGGAIKTVYGSDSARCTKYVTNVMKSLSSMPDKTVDVGSNYGGGSSCALLIKDSAYSDVATFKTAMNGVMLVYELAVPTEESADPFTIPQKVHNFGTEEYVDARPIPIPVGHSTVYITDLKAKLESAPQLPENDGYYILHLDSGMASYTPLTNELPATPTTDGDYSLKCSVSSGTVTLTWEAIE